VTVLGFDHVALPTIDAERLARFYQSLGFVATGIDEWRAGKSLIFALACGDNKINVHPETLFTRRGEEWWLRADTAVPGCGDMCFVWGDTVEALQQLLAREGIPIIDGPVERVGGRGQGTATGTSIYVRDPDQNLVEFITYRD